MNTFIFNCGIIVLCTTYMMTRFVVTSHAATILCHSSAEFFDYNFNSAFP